ncbi:DNA-binding transcriptional LysR family regulator [Prosthecobacter fusiformis]|uniref:DNA-binding transcriptional LysR family regulator n=1 Tax=Prosthecobacter fusiformis TaxID=48464 RepID=A0A4R7S7G2_9BACT|nr:LysR family transcriptional regulator [Prosthecobacter fusiformis]TDU73445.1 DNA-binding transcriptional LysR family regulator [Prosthecobacter fusiformis]
MDQPLDTRQLRAFISLARSGSFTQAGRELHLTQSAISHGIKALENDLACQLFHRQGKSVHLTHHGRELLPHAETVMQAMSQARASLGALDKTPRGRLTIGCTPAASQFILPTVFREFKESFPQYEIRVLPGETPQTIERLLNNEVDLAVTLRPPEVTRLECHGIFEDELEFLVSPLHPWATKAPKVKDATLETFIVSSRSSLNFTMIQEFFLKQGVRLNHFIELGSSEAIKELAKLGLGIAIAARWIARTEIAAGQLVPVPLPKAKLRRRWVTSSLKGRPLNLAERTFVGLCEEVGRRMN